MAEIIWSLILGVLVVAAGCSLWDAVFGAAPSEAPWAADRLQFAAWLALASWWISDGFTRDDLSAVERWGRAVAGGPGITSG